MPKRKPAQAGFGKLLDAWDPPENAGNPVGCVATSFTFDPVFFEDECLGRFLQMESNIDEHGPIYLIEREEKLAEVKCAAVLVDAHHCKGDRSLRWDLLSARVPGAILHAKITILQWTKFIRIIVASANMTKDGYRRNQEIFGYLDYYPGSDTPIEVMNGITEFLNEAVSYSEAEVDEESPAIRRWLDFLRGASEAIQEWGAEKQPPGRAGMKAYPLLIGPGRSTIFDQVSDYWPGKSPLDYASVTSPFFDSPGSSNKPAQALWSSLKQRGSVEVTYNITAEEITGEDALLLHAPRELLEATPRGRSDVETNFTRIHELVGDEPAFRPLHLKNLWLSNKYWVSHIVGSSNFTSAGYGLSRSPNLEANIFYIAPVKHGSTEFKMMQKSLPEGEDIELDQDLEIRWQAKPEEGEDSPDTSMISLPMFFRRAVYLFNSGDPLIDLRFFGSSQTGWKLRLIGDYETFFDETQWTEKGRPEQISLNWTKNRPPSGFEVTWEGCRGSAWWPVNVDRPASLPPPDELKDLPLDALISILTTARPLHQAMRVWLNREGQAGDSFERFVDPHDPHRRVDTSAFLLQRTRRVSWALSALRKKLERPVVTEESLEWRLHGPIGVEAVAKAISKEASSDEERAFLLTELALELARVRPRTAPGFLPSNKVKDKIDNVIVELREQVIKSSTKATKSMKAYIQEAIKEIAQ